MFHTSLHQSSSSSSSQHSSSRDIFAKEKNSCIIHEPFWHNKKKGTVMKMPVFAKKPNNDSGCGARPFGEDDDE